VTLAKKTRTKETGNCLFCLLGVWGESPIWADESRPSQLQVSADSPHTLFNKV